MQGFLESSFFKVLLFILLIYLFSNSEVLKIHKPVPYKDSISGQREMLSVFLRDTLTKVLSSEDFNLFSFILFIYPFFDSV